MAQRIGITALGFALWGGGALRADAKNASEADTQWFAGEWQAGPAPVEGYETIIVAEPTPVTIRYEGGARIDRTSTLRNGQHVTVAFVVKHFGKNYPWWTVDGSGSLVARKVDENTFDLASVGPMGKADWDHASRHTRVTAAADVAAETEVGR